MTTHGNINLEYAQPARRNDSREVTEIDQSGTEVHKAERAQD